jgi:hypothetical protein
LEDGFIKLGRSLKNFGERFYKFGGMLDNYECTYLH